MFLGRIFIYRIEVYPVYTNPVFSCEKRLGGFHESGYVRFAANKKVLIVWCQLRFYLSYRFRNHSTRAAEQAGK